MPHRRLKDMHLHFVADMFRNKGLTMKDSLSAAKDWILLMQKPGYKKGESDFSLIKEKYKKNPRPRIGKKKPARPSTATGKRASKRLVARRKRNGKKGFFPNPSGYYVQKKSGKTGAWNDVTANPGFRKKTSAFDLARRLRKYYPDLNVWFRVIQK